VPPLHFQDFFAPLPGNWSLSPLRISLRHYFVAQTRRLWPGQLPMGSCYSCRRGLTQRFVEVRVKANTELQGWKQTGVNVTQRSAVGREPQCIRKARVRVWYPLLLDIPPMGSWPQSEVSPLSIFQDPTIPS